jgi:hypothetical protein
MNIIIDPENFEQLSEKYTVLELDTFCLTDQDNRKIKAYCVLENIPFTELANLPKLRELHENLLIEYRKQNWNYCKQAIEHLLGKWNHELDTFYDSLLKRVLDLELNDLPSDWDGSLKK